jgi:hypothetical protein
MLQVTPEAKTELHEMLMRALAQQQESPSPDLGFRLVSGSVPEGGAPRLGLALDAPREGDEVIEHAGRSILILGSSASALLEDLTLDLIDTPDGIRLGLCV